MAKLVTDTLLKKSVEDILTELVNSTYSWEEYTPEQISDILEITDEQAMELSKIISDSQVANNKLWSSSKTDTEIKNALIESNKYADELIGKISSISLEYVTTLPTSDIKSNVIYILQGTPNTLNVYNESTSSFVSVGDLNLDLSGYYTSTQVDNLLADKADDNTVVHADDVVQDLTTTSGTTVLSSAGLQTELDKKFDKSGNLSSFSTTPSDENTLSEKAIKTELDKKIDKTSIATSISNASTDDEVVSAKCINDNYGIKTYTSLEQIGLTTGSETLIGIATNLPDNSILTLTITTEYNITEYPYKYGILVVQKLNNYRVGFTFFQDNGTAEWINYYNAGGPDVKGWARLCGTSVTDVPVTKLTVTGWASGNVYYCVKNGICYVHISSLLSTTMSTYGQVIANGLPKPIMPGEWHTISAGLTTGGTLLVQILDNGAMCNYIGSNKVSYFGSFSYPVAES